MIDSTTATVEKNVPFGNGGSRSLVCDVYRPPEGRSKRTAIVQIHGGAFMRGSKEGARTAAPLATLGYTSVAIQYRVAPEAPWPAQIEDVKAGIRWTRSQANRLEFDSDKIVVLGYSAGGHLALVSAGSGNLPALEGDGNNGGIGTQVAACVAFYPRSTVPPIATEGAHPLLGSNPGQDAFQSIRPLSYVNPAFPPTILFHGTSDGTIAVDDTVQLYQALKREQVPVELHLVEGVTHIFDAHAQFAELSALWIDLFLDRHVVSPRTYPSTEPRE